MVSEGLCILAVQSTSCGKHDGGVQISNDSGDGAGSGDASLGTAVTGLQGRQHVGDLQTGHRHTENMLAILYRTNENTHFQKRIC